MGPSLTHMNKTEKSTIAEGGYGRLLSPGNCGLTLASNTLIRRGQCFGQSTARRWISSSRDFTN